MLQSVMRKPITKHEEQRLRENMRGKGEGREMKIRQGGFRIKGKRRQRLMRR